MEHSYDMVYSTEFIYTRLKQSLADLVDCTLFWSKTGATTLGYSTRAASPEVLYMTRGTLFTSLCPVESASSKCQLVLRDFGSTLALKLVPAARGAVVHEAFKDDSGLWERFQVPPAFYRQATSDTVVDEDDHAPLAKDGIAVIRQGGQTNANQTKYVQVFFLCQDGIESLTQGGDILDLRRAVVSSLVAR